MWPFILLFIFLGLAVSAIAGFFILSWRDKKNRRDDWKKLLAILKDFADDKKQFDKTCELSDGERRKAFVASKLDFERDAKAKRFTSVWNRLFGEGALQRDIINRLLRDTALSSRIDQRLVAEIMNLELLLNIQAPVLIGERIDGSLYADGETFCSRAQSLVSDAETLAKNTSLLQLYTCGIFARVDYDTEDSAKDMRALADAVTSSYGMAAADREKKLQAGFQDRFGSDPANDFNSCLRFSELNLGDL